MPKLPLLCLLILSMVAVSSSVCIASDVYMCEVKNVFEVSDEGTFQQSHTTHAVVGQKIAIDRRTGRVIGNILDNGTASTVQILDPGSSKQSFKLLSVFGDEYVKASLLTVEEFSKSPKKPFVGVYGTLTFSGLCE